MLIIFNILFYISFCFYSFSQIVRIYNSLNVLFFKLSFINFSVCVLLGIFAKDYSTFISILGMFVGVEITLFFALNINVVLNKNLFYRHCVIMLGSEDLFGTLPFATELFKCYGHQKEIQDMSDRLGCIFANRYERNKPIKIWTLKRIIEDRLYNTGILNRLCCINDICLLETCLGNIVDDILYENQATISTNKYYIRSREDLLNYTCQNYHRLDRKTK